MSGDNADETMDSLLKEIDDEMENTINLDSQVLEQDKTEKTHRRWSIPLQEIGDETMEMLVSHNTIRNIKIKGAVMSEKPVEEGAKVSTPLLPSRKSVVFSEGVNLHEYAEGSDHENGDSDQDSVKIDTTWKKSSFVPSTEQPSEINQSLVVEAHSDSDEEQTNHDLEITTQDLLDHTVTDLDQKLSHMFDANRNAHRLKLVTEEMDEVTETEQPKKVEYTLQSTKPLITGVSGNIEEASLIHFQTVEDHANDDEDEDEEADLAAEYMNEVRHSPSKIPLINTVTINNFSAHQNKEPQTRLSSGSSCCESVADLTTTIQHDRYNLLDSTTSLPAQRDDKFFGDNDSFSPGEIIAHHPNTSRIFSVATSGDGYKSAKETAPSICSDFSNKDSHAVLFTKSAEASVEDLNISGGLLENDDATFRVERDSTLGDDMVTTDNENSSERSFSESSVPQIPQLPPTLNLQAPEPQSMSTLPQNSVPEDRTANQTDTSRHDASSAGVTQEQTATQLAKSLSSESLPEFCPTHIVTESEEAVTNESTPVKKAISQDLTAGGDDGNNKKVVEQSNTTTALPPSSTDNENSTSDDKCTADMEMNDKVQSPMLPRVDFMESLFQEDPFVEDFDTSAELMDLTRSVKPSNYLSIWHMQEDDIKSVSPALSSNSQFSRYTNSTETSAPNSNLERAFKFKPRVISRSKYYYPEPRYDTLNGNDEYVITKPETALDPLRRNTLVSKRIQNDIQTHRKLFSTSHNIQDSHGLTGEGKDDVEDQDHNSQSLAEGTVQDLAEDCEDISSKESRHDQVELLPSLPDFELGDEFVTYLEAVTNDNRSIFNPSHDERGEYNIWEKDVELDAPASPAKESVSIDVIHRLLDDENKTVKPREPDLQNLRQDDFVGILKTPVKDVSVGRGLSLKGYEALVSEGFGSEGNSRSKYNSGDVSGNLSLTPSPSPSPSPVKRTHVGSPFKVKSKINDSSNGPMSSNDSPIRSSKNDSRIEGQLEVEALHPQESGWDELQEDSVVSADGAKQKAALPDRGNLYLRLKNITGLLLQNVKHHKAEFAVEFDNGMDTIRTPWQALTSNNTCEIDNEFEIILDNDLKKTFRLIITLKCRYESPKMELEEVVEKIPVGRKFPFGKNKFEYQKRYVQRTPKHDEWDFLFARDGSFGRCEIILNDDFLDGIKFHNRPLTFTMINEWARKIDPTDSKKLHELPRRSPYAMGALHVEACYLERTSHLEKFPKTLEIARNIISKYNQQQAIFKEGYMLQEGGDVQSNIQRRFFKLQGNNMLGYHEITGQPKLAINLLKVVRVFGPGDVPKEGERNLTDLVLLSGCFHLVFDNDEKITFSTETAEDGEDWCNKIQEVVSLNRCHQPWVKFFHQFIDLDH